MEQLIAHCHAQMDSTKYFNWIPVENVMIIVTHVKGQPQTAHRAIWLKQG